MRPKFHVTILLGFLLLVPCAYAKDYNVNPFSWKAVGIENEKLKFDGSGESTFGSAGFDEARDFLNGLARKGRLPDMAPFRVEVLWRGRKFVRVIHARKSKKPYDPTPWGKGGRWAYDPVWQKPKFYR